MASNMITVIAITSVAAAGTLLGAMLADLIIRSHKKISNNALNFMVALGGGLLIAAMVLVLVPEGLHKLSYLWASILFMLGSVVFMLLDLWIQRLGGRASQILANTLDSIPESVGIGAAFATIGKVGPLLAILVGLQNIAEGFNSYNELKSGGLSTKANFFLQGLAAILGPLAGVFGLLFLAGHPGLISGLFMFSAGGILYLIFHDIAPLAHREGHWVPTLGTACGFVLGLVSQALVS